MAEVAAAASAQSRAEPNAAGDHARQAIHAALRQTIDRADTSRRYLQLATAVRHLVGEGVLRPGEALPAERHLSAITGFSRVTIRRAIEELLRDGILSRRHGSGTYVARRIEQPLSVLAGFSEDIKSRGMRPGSIWLARELTPPKPDEGLALGVRPGELVARISRVRTADDDPLAIEHAVLPAEILPSPEFAGDSLYAALAERGARPVNGMQRLHAALATAEEARLLLIPVGSAILRIERRGFLENGRPVELTISAYRGDRYDFVATVKGLQQSEGVRAG
jgi:GntR family transcriptional regulator